MDRERLFFAVIVACGLLAAYLFFGAREAWAPVPATDEKAAVEAAVVRFGAQLDFVSLTASPDIASAQMDEYYAPYVSADLLAAWKQNLERAPGRLTSNPHPDRIEVTRAERNEDGSYEVAAQVIEVVSGSSATVSQYSVAMKLRFIGGKWMITGFAKAIQS